ETPAGALSPSLSQLGQQWTLDPYRKSETEGSRREVKLKYKYLGLSVCVPVLQINLSQEEEMEDQSSSSSYRYWVRETSQDAAPLPVARKLTAEEHISQPPLGSVWNRKSHAETCFLTLLNKNMTFQYLKAYEVLEHHPAWCGVQDQSPSLLWCNVRAKDHSSASPGSSTPETPYSPVVESPVEDYLNTDLLNCGEAGTWEEKNINSWASTRIKELLSSVGSLEFSSGKAEILEVSKCVGDATLVTVRNKKRVGYTYELALKFTGKLLCPTQWEWLIQEEKKKIKGQIDIEEFSFGEVDELQVEIRVSEEKDLMQQDKRRIGQDVKQFVQPIRVKLLQFEQEMKDR
ncbi:hypothetical protein GIB67_009836, partial [Kingdonia uniflora]